MKRHSWTTSQVTSALFTGAAVSAAAAGVAFLSNILISRALGPDARGQIAFILQLAYLIAPFLMLGVDRSQLRSDSTQMALVARRHLVPMSILFLIILLPVFRDWRTLAAPIAYALSWLAILRSTSFRLGTFRAYLIAFAAYQMFVAGVIVVLYVVEVPNWVVWLMPYALVTLGLVCYDLIRGGIWTRQWFPAVTALSVRLMPASIAAIVITRIDRILIPFFASEAQLGVYVAVATSTETLLWLAASLADHRVSRLDRSSMTSLHLTTMLARDIAIFGILSTLIGIAIVLWLIPLLGPGFEGGVTLVIPLSLAAVMLAIYRQVVSWILAGPLPKVSTLVESSVAIVAIPIYVYSIWEAGALGAAWGSLVVYTLGTVLGIALVGILGRRRLNDPRSA